MKIFIEGYHSFIMEMNEATLKALTEAKSVERKYEEKKYVYYIKDRTIDFNIIQDRDIVVPDLIAEKLKRVDELEEQNSELSSEKWKLKEQINKLEAKVQAYKELHGAVPDEVSDK